MPFANDCIQLANIPMALIESYEIGQNVETTIRIVIKDSKGHPVDLTKWGIPEGSSSGESSSSCDHHHHHEDEHACEPEHHPESEHPPGEPFDSIPRAASYGVPVCEPKHGYDKPVPIQSLGPPAPDTGPLPPYDGNNYYYYHAYGAPPGKYPRRPPPCRLWHDHDCHKHGVEVVAKEMPNSIMILFKKMCQVRSEEEAKHGIVYLDVDKRESWKPGSFCTMAIVWQHGMRRFNMPFYFVITPAYDEFVPSGGPITIAEIRLWMRDKEPSDNFLLDSIEYQDSEIVAAIRSPVDYWNEVPPPLQELTYSNFPFRFHWIEASTGLLLRMAALWMRRNDLDYSAAGVSVQDTKKWPDYLKMYEERWGRYEQWVKAKKMEINISQSYITLGGFYTSAWGTH